MCVLCGKDVSQRDYDLINNDLLKLKSENASLKEQCVSNREKIEELTAIIVDMKAKEFELARKENELKNNSVVNIPEAISSPNIFGIIGSLINELNAKDYKLRNLKEIPNNLLEVTDRLSSIERVEDIDIRFLGQRSYEPGNPLQMGINIKLSSLNKYEIDVFKSMVRGHYSASVDADPLDGGYLALNITGGFSAVISINFGTFGRSAMPTISLYTDVYNENWKDEYESEVRIKVPREVEGVVSKLAYECRMNVWSELADNK